MKKSYADQIEKMEREVKANSALVKELNGKLAVADQKYQVCLCIVEKMQFTFLLTVGR